MSSTGQLVECVPNFSEGRDRGIIDRITAEIGAVEGATLLDVDPGAATNRTVVTFVAPPDAVVEAAFRAIRRAAELIDMRKHTGAHPRHGATDVCPFVPIAGITAEECVALAHRLGRRVGEELGIPVYLYELAATRPERRSLADLRAGEYEALAEKLARPEWAPDYGPAAFNARAGATNVGVRPFLIAYNINLNTRDDRIAKQIGLSMRERGRTKRDEAGKKIVGAGGDAARAPGLPCCRATGWYIAEYGCGQVTMNLTNYAVTPIHVAFDRAEELAREHGARVTGSEIVGLVPKEALLLAGRHYLRKQSLTTGVSERELITVASRSLGLAEVAPFDPAQKVIEYRVAEARPLVDLRVTELVDLLASNAPAPGGGSVAALNGAMAAGLAAMVAALTHGKKGYREHDAAMEQLGIRAQAAKDALLAAVDRDTAAFNDVMACFRMPKKTDAEKAARDAAICAANKVATEVPLGVLQRIPELLPLVAALVEKGNQNSLSDAGVAGLVARAAAWGAYYNVLINLPGIDDADWRQRTRSVADAELQRVEDAARAVQDAVLTKLRAALA
jgi:glutamate formiminotransferase/formiminotetrahydrofolate cyclodeaminase